MAEQEHTQPMLPAPAAAPSTLDFGKKSIGDLHGGNEPVTWAGGSLELSVAEHRPTSSLHGNPTDRKWMAWAIGGAVTLVLILGFALGTGGDDEAESNDAGPQANVEIPAAPEEPQPLAAPVEPAPEPKSDKAKSKTKIVKKAPPKPESTLATGSEKAVESSSGKPATSKPATSKPASSKPAPAPKPEPAPAKPEGSKLAPPEDDGGGSKADLPDVAGWDDEDAAKGDRSAEGV